MLDYVNSGLFIAQQISGKRKNGKEITKFKD